MPRLINEERLNNCISDMKIFNAADSSAMVIHASLPLLATAGNLNAWCDFDRLSPSPAHQIHEYRLEYSTMLHLDSTRTSETSISSMPRSPPDRHAMDGPCCPTAASPAATRPVTPDMTQSVRQSPGVVNTVVPGPLSSIVPTDHLAHSSYNPNPPLIHF